MAAIKDMVVYICDLYDQGYTLSKIAEITGFSIDQVERVLEDYNENYVPIL